MQVRKVCASLFAIAMLGAGAVVASAPAMAAEEAPAADAQNISVNLDKSTGAVMHGATGFLYGIADDGAPTDTVLNGLSNLHSMVGRPIDGKQHPNGDVMTTADQWKRNGGGDIQIYLKDFYPVPWPYPVYNPSIEQDYFPLLKKQVDAVLKSPYKDSYVYVPLNEPDCGDANYKDGLCVSQNPNVDKDTSNLQNANWIKLKQDWKKMFNYIRSLDPNARIAGPNFSSYYSNHYRDFLEFAKENNVIPDIVTWHELGSPQKFSTDFADWKNIVSDVLGTGANIPVSINEYAPNSTSYIQSPGSMVQYVARFENAKVSADLPYWQPAGDLDQLVVKNNQATGSWWMYNWYGRMTGNTVDVQLADVNQTTQAVASYDAAKQQARVLFGGSDTDNYAVNLKFSGTKYPNGAHVTVYGVDKAEPSTGTYVAKEADLTASQLQSGLALSGLKKSSAYYAIVTPSAAPSSTQTGRYEAEYERLAGSTTIKYTGAEGFSGAGYATGFDAKDSDEAFFVTSTKDGYADIQIRYSASKASKLVLNINRGAGLDLTLPSTRGQWAQTTVRAYLPLGINQLDLKAPQDAAQAAGVNVDYVQLADSTAAVDTYEAESADNTLAGAAKRDGNAVTFVGNGAGNTLQFNKVTAPEDGDYTLTFTYAQNEVADNNSFQTMSRWADVTVNGDAASKQRVVFTNTRSWSSYWTTSIRVNLKKGENTVLIGNSSGYAPNLDKIAVGRTAVQTSMPPQPLNVAPVIAGADNVTISEGAAFDPKSGVSASDAEDGDLTAKIKITGAVNVSKTGSYELLYTVTDSDGALATAKRTVTVAAKTISPGETNGRGTAKPAALASTGSAAALVAAAGAILAAGWMALTIARKHHA